MWTVTRDISVSSVSGYVRWDVCGCAETLAYVCTACDGETKSEIVIPLVVPATANTPARTVGVLDLDSVVHGTFDEEDKVGLEKIAELIVKSCVW